MRSKIIALTSVLFLFSFNLFAQLTVPHLSGKLTINMKEGLIKAEFNLSNLPKLDTGFRVFLNRGMNMKFIKDSTCVLRYNDSPGDDVLKYRMHNGKDYIPLPGSLRVVYSGAFPVYTDTLSFFDYQGVIAFNGKTLRAADSGCWYPVIYDTRNDREIAAVSYDIQVECQDCKTLYLNGSAAKPGPIASFTSKMPYKLLLFAGDYQKQEFDGSDFLNAEMPVPVATAFNKQINQIKRFYEKTLGLPYQQKISFVQHKAVEPFGPNRSWGFVTFPSIAVAGGRFNQQIDMRTGKFNHIIKYSFYAHELGHYYFGTQLIPNAALKWFFLESTAEYMSLKAAEHEYGKDSTTAYIANAKKLLGQKKITPLSKINAAGEIDELYRYTYGPMILLAFERTFGEQKTYKLLKAALKHKGERTDYKFLSKLARQAGVSEKEWLIFEQKIISLEETTQIFPFLVNEKIGKE